MHLPAALYLLSKMFVGSGSGDPPVYGNLLEQDMILQGSKVWGLVAIVGMADVTVLRYFPWLESEFASKSGGFPCSGVFMVCLSTKLFQSCATVACQVSYFVIVNAGADMGSMAASFLILNMVTTSLLVVLNGLEVIMKRGILLSGTLKTAAETAAAAEAATSQRPPSLSRRSMSYSFALPSALRLSAAPYKSRKASKAELELEEMSGRDPSLSAKTAPARDAIPRPSAVPSTAVYGSRSSTFSSIFNPMAPAARISTAGAPRDSEAQSQTLDANPSDQHAESSSSQNVSVTNSSSAET